MYSIMEQYGRLRKCNYQSATESLKQKNLTKCRNKQVKSNLNVNKNVYMQTT